MGRHQAIEKRTEVEFWAPCFSLTNAEKKIKSHYPQMVGVIHEDVLTGNLPETLRLQSDLDRGAMAFFGFAHVAGVSSPMLDLLCIIATHAMLARSGYGPLERPAFWTRRKGMARPALPLSQLSELTSMPVSTLRSLLHSLVRDKAVALVEAPNGVIAAVLREDVLDMSRIERYLRG